MLYYLFQVSASMGLFYAVYWLVLRKLTFHRWNRVYLLASLAVSWLIPWVEIPVEVAQTPIFQPITVVNQPQIITPVAALTKVSADTGQGIFNWGLIYWIGVAFMLFRLLKSVWQIWEMTNHPAQACEGLQVYKTDEKLGNASFFGWIFLETNNLSEKEQQQVLAHEEWHRQLGHSFDKLWVAAQKAILWFNPFLYLYQLSLSEVHEYEVDTRMLGHTDRQSYAQLLLKLNTQNAFAMANLFSRQPLRSRILLMFQLKPINPMKKLTYLLVLPLLAGATWLFAQKKPIENEAKSPIANVTTTPSKSHVSAKMIDHTKSHIACFFTLEDDPSEWFEQYQDRFKKHGFAASIIDKKMNEKGRLETIGFRLENLSNGNSASATFNVKEIIDQELCVEVRANLKTGKVYVRSIELPPPPPVLPKKPLPPLPPVPPVLPKKPLPPLPPAPPPMTPLPPLPPLPETKLSEQPIPPKAPQFFEDEDMFYFDRSPIKNKAGQAADQITVRVRDMRVVIQVKPDEKVLYLIDNKEVSETELMNIDEEITKSAFQVGGYAPGSEGVKKFGEKGKNGVIQIRTNKG